MTYDKIKSHKKAWFHGRYNLRKTTGEGAN